MVIVGTALAGCWQSPDVVENVAIVPDVARASASIGTFYTVTFGTRWNRIMTVPYVVEAVPDDLDVVIIATVDKDAAPVTPRDVEVLNDDV
jgi:hypothetical protein